MSGVRTSAGKPRGLANTRRSKENVKKKKRKKEARRLKYVRKNIRDMCVGIRSNKILEKQSHGRKKQEIEEEEKRTVYFSWVFLFPIFLISFFVLFLANGLSLIACWNFVLSICVI